MNFRSSLFFAIATTSIAIIGLVSFLNLGMPSTLIATLSISAMVAIAYRCFKDWHSFNKRKKPWLVQ